jgi:hypothetical protein
LVRPVSVKLVVAGAEICVYGPPLVVERFT